MKQSVKDKVFATTASLIKKNKMYIPVCLPLASLVYVADKVIRYFVNNSKKYVTICLCLMFFFMSSSFSFPNDNAEDETYLTNSVEESKNLVKNVSISEDEPLLDTKTYEWIEDEDISDEDFVKQLSNTDDIEKFTIEDFLEEYDTTEEIDDSTSAFDKDAWNLILVNKTHPIPDDYEVPLANISKSMKCDERVRDVLLEMLTAAKNDGIDLIVCSPYRDNKLQETLFNRKIKLYMNKGLSYIEAYKITSQKVTVPGASEHQIGLAFDIVTSCHTTLDYAFGDTDAGVWLKEHCNEFGFILRYPLGKEYITGIEFEPWHFRYVGVDAATYIMDNSITLEEFVEELE